MGFEEYRRAIHGTSLRGLTVAGAALENEAREVEDADRMLTAVAIKDHLEVTVEHGSGVKEARGLLRIPRRGDGVAIVPTTRATRMPTFTQVRGRGILRTSCLQNSRKFITVGCTAHTAL